MYQCTSCRYKFSTSSAPSSCPSCGVRFIGTEEVKQFLPTREELEARRSAKKAGWFLLVVAVIGVLAYLSKGWIVRALDEDKLYSAAEAGNSEQAVTLLNRGVNVNAKHTYKEDRTALMVAVESGRIDMVRLLLERGAALNGTDTQGRTALMCAVQSGRADLVKLLLQRGPDLHIADKQGRTALTAALATRNREVINLLSAADPQVAAAAPAVTSPEAAPADHPIPSVAVAAARADVEAIVMKYSSQIHDDHIFFHPNIPQDKIKNAILEYATVPEGERILALIDNGIWRNAKRGVLLTNKTLYGCNYNESPRSFALSSITSVRFNDGSLVDSIFINGFEFFRNNTPEKQSVVLFSDMLAAITARVDPSKAAAIPDDAGLEAIVVKYSSQIRDEYIFFNPNIPPHMLGNAVASYAPVSGGERVLALIDNTVMRNGGSGVLLTNQSIYAHNTGEGPRKHALNSIKSVKFNDGWLLDTIDINGFAFYLASTPRKQSLVLFTEMLNAIAARAQPAKVP